MLTLIASIFVFGIIIFVHELGHYLAARRNGIKVLELALGFGPRVLGWEKDGTAYSLRAVPLGGFCRMLGEDPEERDEPGSFLEKPLRSRFAVVAAGSLMNFLLTIILIFVVHFFFLGVPVEDSTLVGGVIADQPAAEAGLREGDEIVAVEGEAVGKWPELVEKIEGRPGEEITLTLVREGEEKAVSLTPVKEETPEGERGVIGITSPVKKYVFFGSLAMSFEYIYIILASLYLTIAGEIPLEVAGPVGIVDFVGEAAATGLVNLLMLTALISFSLGLINLLPIPALDGGRLLFLLIEGLRGRPLDPEKEGLIHMIGFIMLIGLILVITYQDLIRLDIIR